MINGLLSTLPAGVILTSEAVAGGLCSGTLDRAVRDGRLVRLRRGAYLRRDQWQHEAAAGRHRWMVRAAARQLHDPVFTHESAAVVWRMPVLGRPDVVHILGTSSGSGAVHGAGRRGDVHRHAAASPPPWEVRDGLRVTSAATTVVALSAARGLLASISAADHALRAGLTTDTGLADAILRMGRAPGARRARTVAGLADAWSQSAGESTSRARIHLDGFCAPQLQAQFPVEAGRHAVVDFWWPEAAVVGEFDGRIKYRLGGIDDQRSVEDRLWAEKRREDQLRALGLRVVRWTWADVWHPGALAARLTAAGVPRSR